MSSRVTIQNSHYTLGSSTQSIALEFPKDSKPESAFASEAKRFLAQKLLAFPMAGALSFN